MNDTLQVLELCKEQGFAIGGYEEHEVDKHLTEAIRCVEENEELKIALNHTHAAIDVVEELEVENEELKKQLEKANDIIKAVRQRIEKEL